MSLLAKMTLAEGTGLDGGEPVPGGEKNPFTVTRPALPEHMARAGAAVARFGGGYAAAVGAGAGLCAVAGLNPMTDLLVVGACALHGGQRVIEGYTWHRRGGSAAMRRRRKYQGEANPLEVRRALSPQAARRKMARLAPALDPARAAVSLGVTAHRPAQRVAVSRAETIMVIGVPQTIKTALMSHVLIDAPGAVLATSSRADQYRHTAALREQAGPVHVLDADGYGPGTTFSWDPVDGCADPDVAMRRAGTLMHASPRDHSGKDAWHEARGAALLRWALHAADLARGNMYDARRWVQHPEDELFMKTLRGENAAPGWADSLGSLLLAGGDFLNSAVSSADIALQWMESPQLAAVACPRRGQGLDLAAFLRSPRPGTIYLIGSERPYGSLTPYFTTFATEFLEQARVAAERAGGRLPVPATVVADEAATTARLDFERWCAVTAGYNITVVAGLQTVSQLSAWGSAEVQETILSLFSTKMIAGGATSPGELERLSVICGERDTWRKVPGGKSWEKERVFPAERIRLLPQFHALVVHRNAKPVQIEVSRVWERADYAPVTISDAPEQPVPGITPARSTPDDNSPARDAA